MVQSPSWEANWFAVSQEIPHISRNPKVHYRTHKRLPPVSILGQPNPVHIPTSTSWRSILILSTHLRLGLPSGLFRSGFPTKNIYTPLSSPIRGTCPAHLILLDFIPHANSVRNAKCPGFIKVTKMRNIWQWLELFWISRGGRNTCSSVLSVATSPRACSGAGEKMFLVPQHGRTV